jgi:metal-responsive CopG/Arc/MetJ family transcriptional regulator
MKEQKTYSISIKQNENSLIKDIDYILSKEHISKSFFFRKCAREYIKKYKEKENEYSLFSNP